MIAEIENAILARLMAANSTGALGYRLKTVATYQGEFDEDILEVVTGFPGTWVVFAGEEKPDARTQSDWLCKPTFLVIVGARSLRNEAARRHGAVGEVGAYQMIRDHRALLAGQDLGLPIDPLVPGPIVSLFNRRSREMQAAVYAMHFVTAYDLSVSPPAERIDDFKTFHADWDVPPPLAAEHRPPQTPLPLPEGTADATDHVSLESP